MLISKIKKIFGGRVIVKDTAVTEDAVNYYNLVVELSRGRNDIIGHRGITENQAKRLLAYRSIPFDEEEFDRAYNQFKAARISRAAFQKGLDTKSQDEAMHAPKGGVTLKGKEFKGGEFIPSEGGYQEEYKKQQKTVPGKGREEGWGKTSESPEEKVSIQENFKKKHPNVLGIEACCEGLKRESAIKKAKELRGENIFATIWHQEGPKSGERSRYFVAIPKNTDKKKSPKKMKANKEKVAKLKAKLKKSSVWQNWKMEAGVE